MPFEEIADRVWVARHEWLDVNVSLIAGERGLVIVDSLGSGAAANALVDDVRALGLGQDVVGVINTHEHFDHWFGNATLCAAFGDVPLHAHEVAVEQMPAAAERILELYRDEDDDPHRDAVLATELAPAETTFSSASVLDLGDRQLELIHPGRGHTAGDLIVCIPDADVVLAGDLIEESADRDATPGFGADCHPLEWPLTLDLVLGLIGADTRVVPGHGVVVGQGFVSEQRARIGVLAEMIRDLAVRGIPADEALATGEDWPFDPKYLADAVRRGYEHLPRSQKRLPLIGG